MPTLVISIMVWPSRDRIRAGAEPVLTRANATAAVKSARMTPRTIQISPRTACPLRRRPTTERRRSTTAPQAKPPLRLALGHACDHVIEIHPEIGEYRLGTGTSAAGSPCWAWVASP